MKYHPYDLLHFNYFRLVTPFPVEKMPVILLRDIEEMEFEFEFMKKIFTLKFPLNRCFKSHPLRMVRCHYGRVPISVLRL